MRIGGPDECGIGRCGRGGAAACPGAVRLRRRAAGRGDRRARRRRPARSPTSTAAGACAGRRRAARRGARTRSTSACRRSRTAPAEEAVIAAGAAALRGKAHRASTWPTAAGIAGLVAERRAGHRGRPPLALPGDRRDGRASCSPDRPVRLVTGAWLDKVPPVAWWPRRDRSGGPVVEQAAHVLDLARHAGRRGRPRCTRPATAPRRPVEGADVDGATAATAAVRAAARSARSPRPACWAGSSGPAWRSTPTGWRCRRRGRPGRPGRRRRAPGGRRRPGGRPGRRRPGVRRRGPRASATTSGCRTPRRCAPTALACAIAESAADRRAGAPVRRPHG